MYTHIKIYLQILRITLFLVASNKNNLDVFQWENNKANCGTLIQWNTTVQQE